MKTADEILKETRLKENYHGEDAMIVQAMDIMLRYTVVQLLRQ